MPIYEYKCEKCGKEFEATQDIKDKPLERCILPECDGLVKKLISASSFRLKEGGCGWAKDKYSANGK